MRTIKEIEEEFDERFVRKQYPFLGGQRNHWKYDDEMKMIDEVKSFIQSKIIEVAKSIVPERATERNNCKVSETWELHGVEEIDGWNACVSQISDNIEKL